jgi:hypothetical protein
MHYRPFMRLDCSLNMSRCPQFWLQARHLHWAAEGGPDPSSRTSPRPAFLMGFLSPVDRRSLPCTLGRNVQIKIQSRRISGVCRITQRPHDLYLISEVQAQWPKREHCTSTVRGEYFMSLLALGFGSESLYYFGNAPVWHPSFEMGTAFRRRTKVKISSMQQKSNSGIPGSFDPCC